MTEPVLDFRPSPADQPQREAAVDMRRSVIVQAPAGSGKTSLLTERFLRLLTRVDDPKRVLAITFTRSAAAEMRSRVMNALSYAAGHREDAPKGPESLLAAARDALATSQQLGWDLLEQPDQINIQTIDSLALSIAQQTPLTTSLGPGLQPMENAQSFYKQAALRTLQKLDGSSAADPRDRQVAEAAALLLRQRDNHWQNCADLLARMLATRDQWGRLFPLGRETLDDAYLDSAVRPALERHLRGAVEEHLRDARALLVAQEYLCEQFLSVARDFAGYYSDVPAHYPHQSSAPQAAVEHLQHWLWLANLCFTKAGEPRKLFDGRSGFPPGIPAAIKQRAALIAAEVCEDSLLRDGLFTLRTLPPTQFSDEEWGLAKAMFRLLHQAVLELRLAFAASGQVDFTEVGLAAKQALGAEVPGDDHPSELAFALSEHYQHLLVDEFQDTSRTQHDLVRSLIANWSPGEARTVFFVGDPQQSIYLFRQAEVRLFHHVKAHGVASMLPELVTLTVNFRSERGLVDAHNAMLGKIFADGSDVDFVPSEAFSSKSQPESLRWHFSHKPPSSASSEEKSDAQERDAKDVCDLAETALKGPKSSVAILVRAKKHAHRIMRRLHDRKIGFRAIDMEPLSDRQEVLDVFSLTRAILDPADRIAWLGLLRAPWCGLGLSALDALAGNAKTETIAGSIASRIATLPPEDQARAHHALDAVRAAEAQLRSGDSRLPFAAWSAWRQIGGEACVNSEQYENVSAYFSMLERMDEEGVELRCDTIEAEMQRLCAAPNPDPSLRLEILTIHKAKGLEWDTVIVPQLHLRTGSNDTSAVEWIEDHANEEAAWFLAPVDAQGSKPSPLRAWIKQRHKQKEANEAKRLFYVAATRARRRLHLLGAVEVKDAAVCAPTKGSLLHTAWPAAQAEAELQLLTAEMPGELVRVAAAGEIQAVRNTLYRLPQDWYRAQPVRAGQPQAVGAATTAGPRDASTRASFERRAAGTVLHSFLEQVARRRAEGDDWAMLQAWARATGPRIERLLLAGGVPPSRVSRYAPNVLQLLQTALASENGRWILDSHPHALTEYPITAWNGEACTSFRVDRVFPAGSAPLSEGESHWWIVDYKSAALAGKQLEAFMTTQTAAYAEQMLRYAHALRAALNDARPIRCALYFPALDLIHQIAVLD
jgi:ATP-dependent helicase/nuclease subunit A